ncbi:MAG: DNA polymerase III subunit alpha, partial [Chloroflexota bacterium]
LEGVARHASTHAAGVVISRDPLIDHVPLYKVPKNDQITTQYSMNSIEEIGLLKMDFLGLRTLTIIDRACAFVRQSTEKQLYSDDIPLDDPCIYELLESGDTFGVFQVEGGGMRRASLLIKPTEFEHVIALLALYRPGPMEYIPKFAARKNGESEVFYDHPALEEVLRDTYGIVVYQEQVMKLAVLIAGYSMAEGDLLRKAMGKKKPEELAKHRQQFIERAGALGTERQVAEQLFNIIEPFAGYAFNKAHSAAYAVITCQTAYLKAKYPRQYLAGYLSAERDNAEKVSEAVRECRRLGIAVLAPDVNQSAVDFALEDGGIRFGLSAIKHVGTGAIEAILAERSTNGSFASLEDFCCRVDWSIVNKRVMESLVRCGSMDCLAIERAQVLGSLDRVATFGNAVRNAANSGQASLFGDIEQPPAVLHLDTVPRASIEEKVLWEQELLGMPVTRHPVQDAEPQFVAVGATAVSSIGSEEPDKTARVGGAIRGWRTWTTRAGQTMGAFNLTDFQSSIEATVFERALERVKPKMVEGAIVVVDGKVEIRDGRPQLLVDKVHSIEEAADLAPRQRPGNGGSAHPPGAKTNGNGVSREGAATPRRLTIEVRRSEDRSADTERILAIYVALQRYAGEDEVDIHVRSGVKVQAIPLPNARTGYCDQLGSELRGLAGEEGVRVLESHPTRA